jgi:hypothetical protein
MVFVRIHKRTVEPCYVILTTLQNSVWVQHAADGQPRDAWFRPKHYRSSLWEIPADVYSRSGLAATLEVDGEVECDPG